MSERSEIVYARDPLVHHVPRVVPTRIAQVSETALSMGLRLGQCTVHRGVNLQGRYEARTWHQCDRHALLVVWPD